jgi:hypothetical protein
MEPTGSSLNVKGTMRATAMLALTPGRAPKITPRRLPMRMKNSVNGVKTTSMPRRRRSNVSISLAPFVP